MAQIRGGQISGSVASASFAVTASYAIYAGASFPYIGSAIVSGSVSASVNVTGDIFLIRSGSIDLLSVSSTGTTTVSGSANDLFFVKGIANKTILTVSQSGVVVFATQSVTPSGTAPNGGLTFTSTDFFVGLD